MNVVEELRNVLIEDVRKFGLIDEDGRVYIDDGVQKVLIGVCRK